MFSWINRRFLLSLLIAFLIIFFIRSFLYEPFRVASRSMMPTLLGGDYVLVSKYPYGYSYASFFLLNLPIQGRLWMRYPLRNDVVVFKSPLDGTNYVKRVIGLPGDTVAVINHVLYLNGKAVSLSKISPKTLDEQNTLNTILQGRKYNLLLEKQVKNHGEAPSHRIIDMLGLESDMPLQVVPDGEIFVMGDNRDLSLDSRYPQIGTIPIQNVVGRVDAVLLSFDEDTPLILAPFIPSSWRSWQCCHRVT